MRRKYEWEPKEGETVWSQHIVRTRKKTPIFKVQDVSIYEFDGKPHLMLHGDGITHHTIFHDGTVWVWQEVEL